MLGKFHVAEVMIANSNRLRQTESAFQLMSGLGLQKLFQNNVLKCLIAGEEYIPPSSWATGQTGFRMKNAHLGIARANTSCKQGVKLHLLEINPSQDTKDTGKLVMNRALRRYPPIGYNFTRALVPNIEFTQPRITDPEILSQSLSTVVKIDATIDAEPKGFFSLFDIPSYNPLIAVPSFLSINRVCSESPGWIELYGAGTASRDSLISLSLSL